MKQRPSAPEYTKTQPTNEKSSEPSEKAEAESGHEIASEPSEEIKWKIANLVRDPTARALGQCAWISAQGSVYAAKRIQTSPGREEFRIGRKVFPGESTKP